MRRMHMLWAYMKAMLSMSHCFISQLQLCAEGKFTFVLNSVQNHFAENIWSDQRTWFTTVDTIFVPRCLIHSELIWHQNTESQKTPWPWITIVTVNRTRLSEEVREALNLILPRNPHQSCFIWYWTAAPHPHQLQQTQTCHSYHTLTQLSLLWHFVSTPCVHTEIIYLLHNVHCSRLVLMESLLLQYT